MSEFLNFNNNHEEVEKLILKQVPEVRKILREKHGINVPPESDAFIARSLRLKDGKQEGAVKLIKAFRETMLDFKNWEAPLQPSFYEDFFRTGAITPLTHADKGGRRIFIIRARLWNPQEMSFDGTIIALWILSQYLTMEYVDSQRNGFVSIFDFEGFTLQQAWAVKHWKFLTFAKWGQNGVGGRVKAVHVVNHPRIVGMIYAGIKPFLKEKLKKRIYFHNSLEHLYEHVEPSYLPTYLGGDLDPSSEDCKDRAFVKNLLLQDATFKDMMENVFPCK